MKLFKLLLFLSSLNFLFCINTQAQVNLQIPEICNVTVDTSINRNVIIWDKTQTMGVSSYKIYRETATANVYSVIGNVPYDSLSLFTDTLLWQLQYLSKYKLSTIDSNGIESLLSEARSSTNFFLDYTSNFVDLFWDTIPGDSNYFSSYNIWSGSSISNMLLIDSLPVSFNSYSHYLPFTGSSVDSVVYYILEKVLKTTCVASNPTTNFNSTFSRKQWVASPPTPEICLVTVDTASGINHNVIVWDKIQTMGVTSYNIYKESSQVGYYYWRGNVPYDSLSLFIDTLSIACMKSYRYKLTTIDSNGWESELSNEYKSSLVVNYTLDPTGKHIQLTWSNSVTGQYSMYVIWRGESSKEMKVIDTLPNSQSYYIDYFFPPGSRYYLEKVLLTPCTASSPQTIFYSAFTCIPIFLTGLEQNYTKNNTPQLKIYPNPARDHLNVEFYLEDKQQIKINIYNSIGAKVYEHTMNGNSGINIAKLDLSNLSDNIYFIQVSMNNKVLTRKIVLIN